MPARVPFPRPPRRARRSRSLTLALAPLVAVRRSAPLVAQSARAPADLVLTGGRVFTADASRPWAQAVAVRGERIVAVGTDAEVLRLAGPRTRRVALGGRVVVPGFNDAHDHVGADLPTGDRALHRRSGADARSGLRRGARLAGGARAPSARRALAGHGGGRPRLRRAGRHARGARQRRAVAPGVDRRLVRARRASQHRRAARRRAARRARRARRLADARRDGAADPGASTSTCSTGAGRRLATADGPAATLAAARAHGAESVRLGITTVQDMATGYTPDVARALAASGALRVRHRVLRFPMTDGAGRAGEWALEGADTLLGPTTRVSGVKWVLDGTPVERLALMRAPYADRLGWHGRANFAADTLRALLREAVARDRQPMLHAVGDSTIALLLAAMQDVAPDSVWRRLRPRLEHGDGLARDQFDAARRVGIVVVQNPSHLALRPMMEARWGAERLAGLDHLRSLVDAGYPARPRQRRAAQPGAQPDVRDGAPEPPRRGADARAGGARVHAGQRLRRARGAREGDAGAGDARRPTRCSPRTCSACPPGAPRDRRACSPSSGGRVVHDALSVREQPGHERRRRPRAARPVARARRAASPRR
jgi:predicted amidohydrolase YtcJ